jgi:hypothetical protein
VLELRAPEMRIVSPHQATKGSERGTCARSRDLGKSAGTVEGTEYIGPAMTTSRASACLLGPIGLSYGRSRGRRVGPIPERDYCQGRLYEWNTETSQEARRESTR